MRPAIAFIFVTVVIDVLAMGIVIPVLPKLVEAFEGGNTARAAETYGLFGTAWGLMQFIFMPVVGALSDRFGRRPVILISCFGLGLRLLPDGARAEPRAGSSWAASSRASRRPRSAPRSRTSPT